VARFEVPKGWTAQAYRFVLDPSPAQERAFRSHAGAARKAYNTMLALVKAVMDQRAAERSYGIAGAGLTPALDWSLAGLRKKWNARKDEAAPWWAENSKEAYNTGLDALARGLEAWSKSRTGQRAGKAIGFPKFKSARSRRSVRFTTGTIRAEADRHHVTLPRLGRIRTHESTRKLARRIEAGTARILEIDRDLNAAVNLARLGEPRRGEQSPAGSGPVAGRGAIRETEPARAGDAGGREASTPHRHPPGKTGTASPQGEAA
jgi:putative transposase